jgi:RNA-directed DNA polymerase
VWFEREVKPRLQGAAYLVRYADDAVLVFAREADARRVMAVLPKRLGRYGLTLHPEKTRLVPFRRPPSQSGGGARGQGEGALDVLGFTHYWAKSKKGAWVVKQKTARSRLQRALRKVTEWCKAHRHMLVAKQAETLGRKLRGHYEYFGITGNSQALSSFAYQVKRTWRKWLDRRSQQRHMPWERFWRLLEHYPLPPAICVHSAYRRAAKP